MHWFLCRAENVEKDTPISYPFFHSVQKPGDAIEKTLEMFYSPSLLKETKLGPSVRPLCKLVMTFDPKIYDELPQFYNKEGAKWRKLNFTLEMQVSSGEICWKTRYKGIETGSVRTIMGTEDD
ncbi:hypothetical protein VTL71DRAFT_9679 [Oculimacula yallundae]|uniref:Uncharacterized protein n=1 Tax=Oculimacula yallundae TaxID=86028 RepID=A0ABR4BRJ8_9HELO